MAEELTEYQLRLLEGTLWSCSELFTLNGEHSPIEDVTQGNLNLFEIFIASKRIEGCSEKTIEYYQRTMAIFFQYVAQDIKKIDTDIIRNYLAQYQLKRNVSKTTLDNVRRILSTFFKWLEEEDYIVRSPMKRIHRVKEDKLIKTTFTDEDIELMRDACSNSRDVAIIRNNLLPKLMSGEINFDSFNLTLVLVIF